MSETLLGANGQPVEILDLNGSPVEVDAEIAQLVRALNVAGLRTVASCSGHGHRPGRIALADGRELVIARSYEEAQMIDRLFPLDINGDRIRSARGLDGKSWWQRVQSWRRARGALQ